MSATDTLLAGRVPDNENFAIQRSGTVYTKHVVQVQKLATGQTINDVELQHAFYTQDEDGVNSKLGAITWSGDGISFDVAGQSIFEIGTGGIVVNEGNAAFGTASVNIEDKDLVLASAETLVANLDGGGIILGLVTDELGDPVLTDGVPISLLYSQPNDFWTSSVGINIESGGFTIGTSVDPAVSSVSLDGTGLNIAGATVADDVSLTALGLSVGSDLELTIADGLVAGDITLNSTDGLLIGTALSLTTASGLEAGDITLNSTVGLLIGNDLTLNSTTGLTFVAADTSGDVILDTDGIYIGNDISITKTGGLDLGSASITSDSIKFGVSPDETTIDDTSVQLGTDILLNHDGLSLVDTDAAIFLGNKKWKIVFDSATDNLKFQYDSTGGSGTYVTKAEIKST